MKFDRLFQQDFKIVENKKKIFIIPAVIVVLALILGIIFRFTLGEAVNVGMDFTGGYSMTVTLGSELTDDNFADYEEKAKQIAKDLTDEEGNNYGLVISSVQRQGEASEAALLLKYKAVDKADAEKMAEINAAFNKKLSAEMFYVRPEVSVSGSIVTATYNDNDINLTGDKDAIADKLSNVGITASSIEVDSEARKVTVTLASAPSNEDVAKITEALTITDTYKGKVSEGGQTSSTVSGETLKSALLAISVALLCMLVYIVIRFELLSGIAAVLALVHDLLIMFCGMVIFHIEINANFIAGIITILGYSINNTIIIFDRVRENMKLLGGKRINGKLVKPAYVANLSVQETIWRSINTTLTTLVTISMVAIIGVPSIRIFALPIIFGLLAGTYSSIFIAPTIWAMLMKAFPGAYKGNKTKKPKGDKAAAAPIEK